MGYTEVGRVIRPSFLFSDFQVSSRPLEGIRLFPLPPPTHCDYIHSLGCVLYKRAKDNTLLHKMRGV